MSTKCHACPVPDGRACPARTLPHPRYCQLVDPAHPDFRPEYREHLAADAPSDAGADGPRGPGLVTKALNFAGALASHVAHGMPTLSDADFEARLAVCETCPNLVPPERVCGGSTGCGCYLDVKARWAEQECPLGKWPILKAGPVDPDPGGPVP